MFLNPLYGKLWAGDKPIHRRWRRLLAAAGVRYRNPYKTRHTFALNLLMPGLGVDLYTIGKILGHSNVQTPQRYAHLQVDDLISLAYKQQRPAVNGAHFHRIIYGEWFAHAVNGGS